MPSLEETKATVNVGYQDEDAFGLVADFGGERSGAENSGSNA